MAGIVRTNEDRAGGGLIRPLQTKFKVRGEPAGVIGSPVDPHPPCWLPSPAHCAAVMAEGVSRFRIVQGGQTCFVCVAGNEASCGHPATGRSYYRINQ